jgi:CMP-2-keto-3-deoxyoctulosonic acid synthetase
MKSQWITYGGKQILHIDLSNFKEDLKSFEAELTATVSTIGQEMYRQPPHTVLVLVDLRNTAMTSTAQKLLTERIKDTRQYVKKTAVIGMSGIRRVFLDFFSHLAGSDTSAFDDLETAKEWLVKAK